MPQQNDPFRSYNFKLMIAGVAEGYFTECSGLSLKNDSVPYREAGKNQAVRHIPGPVEYAAITLKFGVTRSKMLFDWMMKAAEGKVERKDVSISLMDEQNSTEAMRWNLRAAWPSEWKGANLAATDQGVAIEKLTLVFDSLERE